MTIDGAEKAEELFQRLLERTPKGFAGSSMGKFNEFRQWLAAELGLGDYRTNTYAVGSAGIAHNFSARWAQNNNISGRRVPLGIAFLAIPDDADEDSLVTTANNTSAKFVDGSKPTSFETIVTFVQPSGQQHLKAHSILTHPNSPVAAKLLELFPGLPVNDVPWTREQAPPGADAPTPHVVAAPGQPLSRALTGDLATALADANYRTDSGLADRVVTSLAAKPFLILAGLSGSGKTLLGIMVSHWMASTTGQVEVVAVGADWSSKHHLVGYPDALDPARFVRTPALDLLLRAAAEPSEPFFLVLDEMNLSHVERYFSDFLSAMESAQPIHLHGGDAPRDGVPAKLDFPRNLFIIGTINVDETTYMFSPKVLDRANVIEFTVSRTAMREYLKGGARLDTADLLGAGAAYGASLVDFSVAQAPLSDIGEEIAPLLVDTLDSLFDTLDKAGLQFGYRTAREMIRYAIAHRRLSGEAWTLVPALDAQIVQRIVPRLGGDMARLRPILFALLAFCRASSEALPPDPAKIAEEMDYLRGAGNDEFLQRCAQVQARFPLTAEKIARMLRKLREHGFTTAIEA
ncbi:McrB family protein [Xanthobacter flavus]|uniref:McrB family protein n=1 Tax=Xanthobacter flavus TaxID=281 RepID=UPI0037264E17